MWGHRVKQNADFASVESPLQIHQPSEEGGIEIQRGVMAAPERRWGGRGHEAGRTHSLLGCVRAGIQEETTSRGTGSLVP